MTNDTTRHWTHTDARRNQTYAIRSALYARRYGAGRYRIAIRAALDARETVRNVERRIAADAIQAIS